MRLPLLIGAFALMASAASLAQEIPLYFHGNLHDGCTGTGNNDFIACDGPLLSTDELDTNPAARFDHNALGSTGAQGPYDSNWTWRPDTAATVDGPTVVLFWASCSAQCIALGGEWAASIWLDGTQVAPATDDFIINATPSTPDVPELLKGSFVIPSPISVEAGAELTLKLEGRWSDSQAGSRIYYDSQDSCVSGGDGPCDSQVVFNAEDTDEDGVPDLLDECPGTPEGESVDETGCPPAAACATEGAVIAKAAIPVSGPIAVDPEVLGEWSSLNRDANYGAFVHFYRQGNNAAQDGVLKTLGLKKTRDYRRYTSSVFVEGPVWAFQRLASHPWISRIEYNRPLRYFDATQSWATRTRMAQEVVAGGPYFDANGDRLAGKGVTLAAIDSGLFGAHPDFEGRIVRNFKWAGGNYVDVSYADSENGGGGHGTHVTGIIAGGGNQSDGGYPVAEVAPYLQGTFTSAAPEAGIMHWAQGAGVLLLSVNDAYSHMLDNLGTDSFQALRAVNNSYGEIDPGTPYDPNNTGKQMVKQIIGCGINMVYAAGNDGGDGSADMTSSYCKDPTPGVICVASYNDEGTGRLDGTVSGFSSRGDATKPAEYPDIAAPGDLSTSTCAQATPTQAICTGGDDSSAETEWQPWYGTISGTSMATPNVVGIIGVLAQAEPSLTPAEIEMLIQRSARKFADGYVDDPQNPDGTIHFAYGAGLIDTQAALQDLIASGTDITFGGALPEDLEWTAFDGDTDLDVSELAADVVKLTMQNYNLDGITGVMYRMTVLDFGDFFSSAIRYRLETFARGAPAMTTIVATPDSVVAAEPGEGNNAIATLIVREENVIRFFVPYSQMSYPPIDEPIHNIRVVVTSDAGVTDYAPSPANGTIGSDALQPMYGRAFTTRLLPGAVPPSNERACELPGITVATSPPGYAFSTGSNSGHDDLRRMWFSEPGDMPGKLVMTMKVENLTPTPINNYRWYVYFKTPARPDDELWAAMDTVAPGGSSASPGFAHGLRTVTPAPGTSGVGSYPVEGSLDPESTWDPDGTITLVLDKAAFGLETGMTITNIAGAVRSTSNPENGNGLTSDTASAIGPYTLVGNIPCPVGDGPIAALVASATSGDAPLTVDFDASGSAPGAAAIASYTFDFGDASDPVTQAGPTIQHLYDTPGQYTAQATVTDVDGNTNENVAALTIEVTRVNTAPIADAGEPFSINEGETATLSGSATDAENDPMTYQWTHVADTIEIQDAASATASFIAPEVDVESTFTFQLTVTDELGESATDTVRVTVLDVPETLTEPAAEPADVAGETKILGGAFGLAGLLMFAGFAGIARHRRYRA